MFVNIGNKFLVKSEVAGSGNSKGASVIDLTDADMKIWKKVVLIDDMFEVDAYGELTFSDMTGIFADSLISAEGLKLETKLGNDEDGYIEHTYAVLENQLISAIMTDHIAGDITLGITSYAKFLDYTRSYAWEDSISNIVRDICKNVFKLDDKKLFIEETEGTDIWYQINKTSIQFIEDLADEAYSKDYPNSPFLTFINSNNEFYFMSIDKLFEGESINNSGSPYRLLLNPDNSYNVLAIKDFTVQLSGMDLNKENYKKKAYRIENNGSIPEPEISNIKDHITKGKGDILIRSDILEKYPQTDIVNFGIYEEETDLPNYRGFLNSFFRESSLYMKMDITIDFNPKAVSGKIIELDIDSAIKEKAEKSKEYTGRWLIIESRHFFDYDQQPFTQLTIAKGRVEVDSSHPFKKQNLK